MTAPLPWQTAWVVGASTGIGRELARKLGSAGVRVVVSARSADGLASLAAAHGRMVALPLDVTDRAAVAAAAREAEERVGPLDLVVLNAGVWHPMGGRDFDAAKSAASMAVNYMGIAHALEALIPPMVARGSGHIAMTSSVAGYRGLPKAAAYAPSKAAVIALAETLAPDLARHGVTVTVINPGFVETPMTSVNDFPMPFLMKPDAAADVILKGLVRRRFEIVFPWQMAVLMKLARVLPYPLFFWFARTFMTPPSRRT